MEPECSLPFSQKAPPPPFVPILSQIDPMHVVPIEFFKINLSTPSKFKKGKFSVILSYMHSSWGLTKYIFGKQIFLSSFVKVPHFHLGPLWKSQIHVRSLRPTLSKRLFCVGTLTLVKSNGFSFRKTVWEETDTLDNIQIDSHVYQLFIVSITHSNTRTCEPTSRCAAWLCL